MIRCASVEFVYLRSDSAQPPEATVESVQNIEIEREIEIKIKIKIKNLRKKRRVFRSPTHT